MRRHPRRDELLGFVTVLKEGPRGRYYIGFDRAAAAAGLPLYLALDDRSRRSHRMEMSAAFPRTPASKPRPAWGAKPEHMCVYRRIGTPPSIFSSANSSMPSSPGSARTFSLQTTKKPATAKTDDAAC